MAQTCSLWKAGTLVSSEHLESLSLETFSKETAKRVCIALGTTLPLQLQVITSNPQRQTCLSQIAKQFNTLYEQLTSGKMPVPETMSYFTSTSTVAVRDLTIKQAIGAQPLPWIKAALLSVLQAIPKIRQQLKDAHDSCVQRLFYLLETAEEIQIEKKELAPLKSFIASHICLYECNQKNIASLTWDQALQKWTVQHKIDGTSVSQRVQQIQKHLCEISCLKTDHTGKVRFDEYSNSQDTPYVSFRDFLVSESVTYICSLFDIPQSPSYTSLLSDVFKKHESARSLVLLYCNTLTEIAWKNTSITSFAEHAQDPSNSLRKLLVQEFFSLLETQFPCEQFQDPLKTTLQKRPDDIASFYQANYSHISFSTAQDQAQRLQSFITNFYLLEKFCICTLFLRMADYTPQDHARLPINWPLFAIFWESTSATLTTWMRTAHKTTSKLFNGIHILVEIEREYHFEIPVQDKLLLAIRYLNNSHKNFAALYKTHTELSSRFSVPASPLQRLSFLVDHAHRLDPPFLHKEITSQTTRLTATEEEYFTAAQNNLSVQFFGVMLQLAPTNNYLNLTPTADDFITLCINGPNPSISLKNFTSHTQVSKQITAVGIRYNFSAVQRLLLFVQCIYHRIKETEPPESGVFREQRTHSFADHIATLMALEDYLRLSLPPEVVFSWLIYQELSPTGINDLISECKKIRGQDTFDVQMIETLHSAIDEQFGSQQTLKVFPQVDLGYKEALKVLCLRSLYNLEIAQFAKSTPRYIPEFFFPKTLPCPDYALTSSFSSAAPQGKYPHYHPAFFGTWTSTQDVFSYSLWITKTAKHLETCSASFTLPISKKRLQQLSIEHPPLYAFLADILSLFVSEMSRLTKYSHNSLVPQQDDQGGYQACYQAINNLLFSPKIANDKMLRMAIQEYPQLCKDELAAIFAFAYQLHHFVRTSFIQFSSPLPTMGIPGSFLELASKGNIYDHGHCLSLLPPATQQDFSASVDCFTLSKKPFPVSIAPGKYSTASKFYEMTGAISKNIIYDISNTSDLLSVAISIENSPISLQMHYPLNQSYLNLEELITWQTLLIKSAYYQSEFNITPVITGLQKLQIT